MFTSRFNHSVATESWAESQWSREATIQFNSSGKKKKKDLLIFWIVSLKVVHSAIITLYITLNTSLFKKQHVSLYVTVCVSKHSEVHLSHLTYSYCSRSSIASVPYLIICRWIFYLLALDEKKKQLQSFHPGALDSAYVSSSDLIGQVKALSLTERKACEQDVALSRARKWRPLPRRGKSVVAAHLPQAPQKKNETNCHSGRKCVKAEERLEKKSRFDRFSFSVKEAASEWVSEWHWHTAPVWCFRQHSGATISSRASSLF